MPISNRYGFHKLFGVPGWENIQKLHDDFAMELYCYRFHEEMRRHGYLLETTPQFHFKNIVNQLWGPHNKIAHFEWNPWAEKMLDVLHVHPITGQQRPHCAFSGCGSSGKTDMGAVYAIVNWLCDPMNTMVIATSTDLKASKKRIWGAIERYWLAVPNFWPGKLVSSQLTIATIDAKADQRLSDKSGISIVAGEKKKEKEAVGKIIGCHNKRVFFIADELPELSEAILQAAFGNLNINPFFQLVALGNFKSWYDAFGVLTRPKHGNIELLTVEDTEWETESGYCVRFDGLKSPNILSGKDEWKGIYGSKQLASHRKDLGENTAMFWRMCRSFPAPIGLDDSIYSESDLIASNARGSVTWTGDYIKVSGLDPSFTNGGDRSVQHFGMLGRDVTGKTVLLRYKTELLRENVLLKNKPRNFQIAELFRDNCIREGVHPYNASVDSTAAGGVFCDIVSEVWSNQVMRVDFSGSPSESPISASSVKTAKDSYDRKVTELWYCGLEFLKAGQLKGLTDDLAREMKARKYDTTKGAEGLKIRVEPKVDMKLRLGFSPDEADAYFIMLELCRQRLSFLAGTPTTGFNAKAKKWEDEVKAANEVYGSVDYSYQENVDFGLLYR